MDLTVGDDNPTLDILEARRMNLLEAITHIHGEAFLEYYSKEELPHKVQLPSDMGFSDLVPIIVEEMKCSFSYHPYSMPSVASHVGFANIRDAVYFKMRVY